VLRELHYRLLQVDHRTMLRRLLRRDSNASRIAKAIARIRLDLAEPLPVSELARVATMSTSTFHKPVQPGVRADVRRRTAPRRTEPRDCRLSNCPTAVGTALIARRCGS
jgi:hypothetical protein